MKHALQTLMVKFQVWKEDSGQDLIEYALVVAVIAVAATAGMTTLASSLNSAFTNVGSKLATYTT